MIFFLATKFVLRWVMDLGGFLDFICELYYGRSNEFGFFFLLFDCEYIEGLCLII